MKNSRKNLSQTGAGRDPFDTFLIWTMIVSVAILAGCISVLFPLAYLWIVGTVGIIATFGVTVGLAASMFSDGGIFGFLCAGEIIKGGFYVIGAILAGLAEASK